MPAESSTRTPTRSRAACTASASRWSTRCRERLDLRIWRDGKEYFMRFRDGDAEAPSSWSATRRRAASAAPRSPSCPSTDDLHQDRVRLRDARAPAARAGLPEFRRAHRADRRARRRAEGRRAVLRRRPRGVRRVSRPHQAGPAQPADRRSAARGRHRPSKSRCSGTTAITRRCCASPTTSRSATAARIWPASAAR